MSDRDEVIKFMSNIKGRTPILLIGKAANIFKKIYSNRIYNLKCEEDLQDINNMNISNGSTANIRELIEEKGRSDSPGRPILYGVTDKFLDYFKDLLNEHTVKLANGFDAVVCFVNDECDKKEEINEGWTFVYAKRLKFEYTFEKPE